MTDFGRRQGDMQKSTYDTDADGVVDDAEKLDGSTKAEVQDHTPKDHTHVEADITDLDHDATSIGGIPVDTSGVAGDEYLAYSYSQQKLIFYEAPESPPTDVVQMSGQGHVQIRTIKVAIKDGTNAATLKCRVYAGQNGDAIGDTDNIPKDGSAGYFALNSSGKQLTIDHDGLSGNVLLVFGSMERDQSGNSLSCTPSLSGTDILLQFQVGGGSGPIDLTTAVDTGEVWANVLYVTDA